MAPFSIVAVSTRPNDQRLHRDSVAVRESHYGGPMAWAVKRRTRRSRLGALAAAGFVALAALTAGTDAANAAFPGDAGPIAYSKTSTDEVGEGLLERLGGLFARGPRLRGQEPRQLTSEPNDHSPAYSRDGRQIVFVSDDGEGSSSIYVMNGDGSGRREVTTDGLGGSDPQFFPNGRAIAFARTVDGHTHIFTMRLDGSGLHQWTYGAYDDSDPAISPNGRRIAFVSDRDPDGRRDRSDIFSMRADGSGLGVLIDGPRSEYEPDYAPSGRRLAFTSSRGRGTGVFVARADGRRVRRLTPCNPFPPRCRAYVSPAFSPDGRHIAMLGVGRHTSTITTIRSDGSGFTATIDSGGTEEEGFGSHVGAPAWGPQPQG